MQRDRILLIEDDELVLEFVTKLLSTGDRSIVQARNCTEALAACRADHPDVILCDFELPDGTALDLLPQIRSIDPLARGVCPPPEARA